MTDDELAVERTGDGWVFRERGGGDGDAWIWTDIVAPAVDTVDDDDANRYCGQQGDG
jgi:hypothetical protein